MVQSWINRVWRPDFRYGVVTTDPDSGLLGWQVSGLSGGSQRRRHKQLFHFLRTKGEVIRLLRVSDELSKATEVVQKAKLEPCIRLVKTKEELIRTITNVLLAGANAWDNGDEDAWDEGGLFVCHFWYDRSHDPRAIARELRQERVRRRKNVRDD
jgi:hypothetical protein